MGLPPVVEDVLVVAQEGLLGARHQEAHDVVADAGEALHLGFGEVCRRDAPEAFLVGLLLGHVRVEVRCAGWLLAASLCDGALVWTPCDVRWPRP